MFLSVRTTILISLLAAGPAMAEPLAVAQAFTFGQDGSVQSYAVGTASGATSVAGAVASMAGGAGSSGAFAAQTDGGSMTASITMGEVNAYETMVTIGQPAAPVGFDCEPETELCSY